MQEGMKKIGRIYQDLPSRYVKLVSLHKSGDVHLTIARKPAKGDKRNANRGWRDQISKLR